jgi:hypothetical protein
LHPFGKNAMKFRKKAISARAFADTMAAERSDQL